MSGPGGAVRAVAGAIDAVNGFVGRAASLLCLLMVVLELGVVVGRYVFGVGRVGVQETILYAHAGLFLLVAAWALKAGAHVRVDVLYRTARPRTKALIDLAGNLLLLVPTCILIVVVSWRYVGASWAVLERSREASGLPGVFLVKTLIIVFAAMVGLQGIANAIRAGLALRGDARELAAFATHRADAG